MGTLRRKSSIIAGKLLCLVLATGLLTIWCSPRTGIVHASIIAMKGTRATPMTQSRHRSSRATCLRRLMASSSVMDRPSFTHHHISTPDAEHAIDTLDQISHLQSKQSDDSDTIETIAESQVEQQQLELIEYESGGLVRVVHSEDELLQIFNEDEKQETFVIEFAQRKCRPCRYFEKKFVRLAQTYGPKSVQFLKLYGETNESTKNLFRKYRVTATPSFLLFKEGELVKRMWGINERKLTDKIEAVLFNDSDDEMVVPPA